MVESRAFPLKIKNNLTEILRIAIKKWIMIEKILALKNLVITIFKNKGRNYWMRGKARGRQ